MNTTAKSKTISLREKMLETQQTDFIVELGAGRNYTFDLEDFCSGVGTDWRKEGENEHRE